MQIIHGIRNLPAVKLEPGSDRSSETSSLKNVALTIGNFDGLHLGHRKLIGQVVEAARKSNSKSVVMTFEPHPVKVLYPDRKLHRIFDLEDQEKQLAALGVDILVVEPFSREFSQLDPERYLTEWIYRPFVPRFLIVGYDFSFGANRRGSIDFLKTHGAALGIEVDVVPPVKLGDILVSSTRIRQAIEAGDVRLANELLGRRFYIRGIVERGAGRGRTIGIPTANLHTSAETIPARGVYAARVHCGAKIYDAAVNIGWNPTFRDNEASPAETHSIEAHIIGESDLDLYGESLQIDFVDRIRDERKFAGVNELVSQIRADIQTSLNVLSAGRGARE